MGASTVSLLSALLDDASAEQRSGRRLARLWMEGGLFTGCALVLAEAFGFPESGFFAVFLGAAGLSHRLETILDENREDIVERHLGSLQANTRTAVSVLMLFLGSLAAFVVAALWIGERHIGRPFGFVLEMSGIGRETILTQPYESAPRLFVHSALVLSAFAGLSLVYRTYGALLALVSSACTWGLVISFLIRRGVTDSPLPAPVFVLVSVLAVLPHLLLKAVAYVLGALAAIFLSKGLTTYSFSDPILRRVLTAVLLLGVAAIAGVALAALVEATLPRVVLAHLR